MDGSRPRVRQTGSCGQKTSSTLSASRVHLEFMFRVRSTSCDEPNTREATENVVERTHVLQSHLKGNGVRTNTVCSEGTFHTEGKDFPWTGNSAPDKQLTFFF